MEIFQALLTAWPTAMPELSPRRPDSNIAALVIAAEQKLDPTFAQATAEKKAALRAGLWLLADDLGRAHQICQNIPTPHGSAWHAIMHRREGDFSNSLYWFGKARDVRWALSGQPAEPGPEPTLATAVRHALLQTPAIAARPEAAQWANELAAQPYDPARLVEFAEAAARDSQSSDWQNALLTIQRIEWLGLFTECLRSTR